MSNYTVSLTAPGALYLILAVLTTLLVISPSIFVLYYKFKGQIVPSVKKNIFIVVSLLLGVSSLYITSIPFTGKIQLDDKQLTLGAFPYKHAVSYGSIEFETLQVEDHFSTNAFTRTNGIGLHDFLCGWFSDNRKDHGDGEAFMFLTSSQNVISFKTKDNLLILFSPEDPNNFVNQLKIKAHEKPN